MGGIVLNWRAYAPSLLLMLAGCTGGGFDSLSSGAEPDQPPPDGDTPPAPAANPDPGAPQPGPPERTGPQLNEPATHPIGDEPNVEAPMSADPDLCRFLVLHDASGELAVTYADGSAHSLAHDNALIQEWGADVATIGPYAIVGIAAEDWPDAPLLTFFHAEHGLLWHGTQPHGSDYVRAIGFSALTREGFAVLNDGSVLDANGAQHHVPEAGFAPALPNIDSAGYVLVSHAGELAYWDVVGDRMDRAPTEGVGRAVIAPITLGGIEGSEVAFVENLGGGAMAFTGLSREGLARAELAPAAVQLIQNGEPWIQNDVYEGNAALLIAESRPLAWIHAGRAPLAIEGGAALPAGNLLHSTGGCFTDASPAATTANELLASLWRVNIEDGTFEIGLRFPIPADLTPELPSDGVFYVPPRCIGDGRMSIVLRGTEGLALFAEGASALERISPWSQYFPDEPAPTYANTALPAAERRIIGAFSRPYPPERCEVRNGNDGTTLIDHARGEEHFVPGFATISWLDDAEPAR